MSAPGIPDITIACVQCEGHEVECVTTLVDVETGPDGAPALLIRVDTSPLLAHQQIHHPRSASA